MSLTISSQQVFQREDTNPGGSAKATGEIINQLGAELLEYVFIMELAFLNGWKQLEAPVWRIATEEKGTKAGYASK